MLYHPRVNGNTFGQGKISDCYRKRTPSGVGFRKVDDLTSLRFPSISKIFSSVRFYEVQLLHPVILCTFQMPPLQI